jgi:hypothetical protein
MNKLKRRIILLALSFLPLEKQATVSRWLRGRQELKKLRKADCVIITCPKSGRTWLRIMLSRLVQKRLDLDKTAIIGTTSFHRANPSLPRIFFTHDSYIGDYTGNRESKSDYLGKRVVFLVRDPRDIAVSAYFQWKFRTDRQKRALHSPFFEGRDLSIYDFAMHRKGSLIKNIDRMNSWHRARNQLDELLIVRYEDLRAEPEKWLARVADFSGYTASEEEVADAVEYASLENMKKMEREGSFGDKSRRFSSGRQESSDAYKVRRGKIGGYRDYFTDEQLLDIDALVETTLAPEYGYTNRPDKAKNNSNTAPWQTGPASQR